MIHVANFPEYDFGIKRTKSGKYAVVHLLKYRDGRCETGGIERIFSSEKEAQDYIDDRTLID